MGVYIVKCGMWYTNYRPTAWRTIAGITEFHIDFSFVFYNDRWQLWHSKFLKLYCFITFQFLLLYVYIHNQQKVGL